MINLFIDEGSSPAEYYFTGFQIYRIKELAYTVKNIYRGTYTSVSWLNDDYSGWVRGSENTDMEAYLILNARKVDQQFYNTICQQKNS